MSILFCQRTWFLEGRGWWWWSVGEKASAIVVFTGPETVSRRGTSEANGTITMIYFLPFLFYISTLFFPTLAAVISEFPRHGINKVLPWKHISHVLTAGTFPKNQGPLENLQLNFFRVYFVYNNIFFFHFVYWLKDWTALGNILFSSLAVRALPEGGGSNRWWLGENSI